MNDDVNPDWITTEQLQERLNIELFATDDRSYSDADAEPSVVSGALTVHTTDPIDVVGPVLESAGFELVAPPSENHPSRAVWIRGRKGALPQIARLHWAQDPSQNKSVFRPELDLEFDTVPAQPAVFARPNPEPADA